MARIGAIILGQTRVRHKLYQNIEGIATECIDKENMQTLYAVPQGEAKPGVEREVFWIDSDNIELIYGQSRGK